MILHIFAGVYIIVVMGFASLSVVCAVGVTWMHNQGTKGRPVPSAVRKVCLFLNRWVRVRVRTNLSNNSSPNAPSTAETTPDLKTPLVQSYSSVNLTFKNSAREYFKTTCCERERAKRSGNIVNMRHSSKSGGATTTQPLTSPALSERSKLQHSNNNNHATSSRNASSRRHQRQATSHQRTVLAAEDALDKVIALSTKSGITTVSASRNAEAVREADNVVVPDNIVIPTDAPAQRNTFTETVNTSSLKRKGSTRSLRTPSSQQQADILRSLNLILEQQGEISKKLDTQIMNVEWKDMAEIVDRAAFWIYLFMTLTMTVVILVIVPLGKAVAI